MDSPAPLSNALIVGTLLSGVVVAWAYRKRLLTPSGSAAAMAVGVAAVCSGWLVTSALLFFFFSAAFWSRLLGRTHQKTTLVQEQAQPRDAFQVLATGGLPVVAGLVFRLTGNAQWEWVALSALAFATADTWATEWGQTQGSPPRLLGWGAEVPAGLSGGVTLRGTLGSLAGSCCVGMMGWVGFHSSPLATLFLLGAIGFTGSVVDSVLGATLQRRLECAVCRRPTERSRHCETDAVRIHGFLSNTGVNLIGSALASGLGWILYP